MEYKTVHIHHGVRGKSNIIPALIPSLIFILVLYLLITFVRKDDSYISGGLSSKTRVLGDETKEEFK